MYPDENYNIITTLQQEIGDLKAQLAERVPLTRRPLTKREYFAGLAMLGHIISEGHQGLTLETLVVVASMEADAMIKELEK